MELRHQFVRCFRVTTLKLLPKIKVSLRSYWSLSDSLRKALLALRATLCLTPPWELPKWRYKANLFGSFELQGPNCCRKQQLCPGTYGSLQLSTEKAPGLFPTKNLMALSGQSPGPRSEFSDEYPRARNPTSLVPLRHPKFLMTASVAKLLVRDQNLVISPHRPSQGYLRAPGMVWYRSHSILQPICHTVDSVCLAKGSKSAQKTKVFC